MKALNTLKTLTTGIALVAGLGQAHADPQLEKYKNRYNQMNCSAFQTGLVDVTETHSESELVEAVLNHLEKETYRNFESFKKTGMKFGLNFKGIKIGGNGDEEKDVRKTFNDKLKHILKTDKLARNKFKQRILKANTDVLEQWGACNRLQAQVFMYSSKTPGVMCNVYQGKDPNEIIFNIERVEFESRQGEVSGWHFSFDQNKLSLEIEKKTGWFGRVKKVQWSGEPMPALTKYGQAFRFKRKPGVEGRKAGTITFVDHRGVYRCQFDLDSLSYPEIVVEEPVLEPILEKPKKVLPKVALHQVNYGRDAGNGRREEKATAWYYDQVIKDINTRCSQRNDGRCEFMVDTRTVVPNNKKPSDLPEDHMWADIRYSCNGVPQPWKRAQGGRKTTLECR